MKQGGNTPLDAGEVQFLDSVEEGAAIVRKRQRDEEAQQLEAFAQQRETAVVRPAPSLPRAELVQRRKPEAPVQARRPGITVFVRPIASIQPAAHLSVKPASTNPADCAAPALGLAGLAAYGSDDDD